MYKRLKGIRKILSYNECENMKYQGKRVKGSRTEESLKAVHLKEA